MTILIGEKIRALRFYEGSPDGQWDHVAVACIRQSIAIDTNPHYHRPPLKVTPWGQDH